MLKHKRKKHYTHPSFSRRRPAGLKPVAAYRWHLFAAALLIMVSVPIGLVLARPGPAVMWQNIRHTGARSGSDRHDTDRPSNDKHRAAGTAAAGNRTAKRNASLNVRSGQAGIAVSTDDRSSAGAATPAMSKGSPPATIPVASGRQKADEPARQSPAVTASGILHDNIITTIFWIGEAADDSNAHISNAESAWDGSWQRHFGGFDDPDHRGKDYNPAGFTPGENPFYVALPYNDLDDAGNRKTTAANCPNSTSQISWCKNAWVKITKNGKTAYAQWQDVGPMQEDDTAYVFGTAAPKNLWGAKAGLDVSPAVRDYLDLSDVDRTAWSFVSASAVPAGPWKMIVTSNPGGW